MNMSDSESEVQPAFVPALGSEETGRRHLTGRRVGFAVAVISSILLLANAFTWSTWNRFWGNSVMPAWQWLLVALTLGFVGTSILSFRYSGLLLRWTYRTAAAWLGALSFLFVGAVGCWLLFFATTLLGVPAERQVLAQVAFGLAGLGCAYGLINAARLRVTRVKVRLENLPEAWRGRTAVLISDVHLGNVRGASFLRRIVSRIHRLRPEAVFISGDMFDGGKVDAEAVVKPLCDLAVPTYFVTGNHDEFADRRVLLQALANSGVQVLNNEKVELNGLQLVGVHDAESAEPQMLGSILARAKLDTSRPSILLAHQPANLDIAAKAGISLQLSGHTHNGQLWPWSWIAQRVHGRFAYGLNRFGNLQVLTSSGAGTWGPPLRVGTRSELVQITFEA